MVAIVLALASLGSLALASPISARSAYAVKEVHPVPWGWKHLDRAPADHTIRLHIALRQGKFDELERHLYEVSDPDHHRYGQHLSDEEVHELVRPTDETTELVHEWLAEHGIGEDALSYSPAKDWVQVSLPVEAVERLIDAEYGVYQHEDGFTLVRTPQWSVPQHLHEHIMTIQPTNSFLRAAPVSVGYKPSGDHLVTVPLEVPAGEPDASSPISKVCNVSAVTPACLRTLYGTIDYKPAALGKNKVALTDYLGESNNRSDIELFLKQFRPEAAGYAHKFPVQVINHGNNQQGPENATELKAGKDLEGNLDAETIIGITYPTKLQVYTTGGSPPFHKDKNTPTDTNEPYLIWLNYVLKQKDLPQVISNSYDDDERTVPNSYANAVCRGFAQLGSRGVSLFFGSGDSGVGANGTCFTNSKPVKPSFNAQFPSSCPYVTSVGATKNFNPEVVAYDSANGFSSGGGFSNYFSRPAYQNSAVTGFLKTFGSTKFAGLYNRSGRAYPDLSAQGQRYITTWDGQNVLLDGTSAATPTTASVFALVNDYLLSHGKPVLGFLNPWLYKKGYAAFTDVTSGSALGCNTSGFPAVTGWDPVSGFGTPNFKKIIKLV